MFEHRTVGGWRLGPWLGRGGVAWWRVGDPFWAFLSLGGALSLACGGSPLRAVSDAGTGAPMHLDPGVQLTLAGPDSLLWDGQGGIDVGPLVVTIQSAIPGLMVEVRPGGTLLLLVIPVTPGQQRVCSVRWLARWWTQQFGTVSHGYYEWHLLKRVPTEVWFSDFTPWPHIPGWLCPAPGRVRMYAILVAARAERVFVFPDDSFFEPAMGVPGAVVRRAPRGAPVLVELPARQFPAGGELLSIWGADLAPGRIAYAVSNSLDVDLVQVRSGN